MGAVAAPVWLANPTPCALTTPRTPLRPPAPRHPALCAMAIAAPWF